MHIKLYIILLGYNRVVLNCLLNPSHIIPIIVLFYFFNRGGIRAVLRGNGQRRQIFPECHSFVKVRGALSALNMLIGAQILGKERELLDTTLGGFGTTTVHRSVG